MFQLNKLVSIVKKRKRVGRGGSRGGTSGKGHKGQKARSGPSIGAFFEGGQMPISRRLPKRGFNNTRFKEKYEIVNLKKLENLFENDATINKEVLIKKGIIKDNKKVLLKILGGFNLTKKFTISADAFSKSAIESINKVGGKTEITL